MKKLVLALLMVISACALIFSGCPSPETTAPPETQVFKLRFACVLPEMMKDAISGPFFCDYLEEHSGGRIEITRNYGGSLAAAEEMLDLVRTGGADIIELSPVNGYRDSLPIIGGLQFMYLQDIREMLPFMNGIVLDNPETAPLCEEELARQNIVWMNFESSSHSVIVCNFLPAATLADLQGKKVGCFSDMPFLDTLGMSSVMGDLNETYESLARGVYDAIYINASVMAVWRLQEVSKAALLDGPSAAAGGVVMNRDTWNSLPPDLQQVCRDAAAAAADNSITVLEALMDENVRMFEESGCEVNWLPPEEQAIVYAAMYDDWETGFTELCGRVGVSPEDRDTVMGYVHDFAFAQ